MVICNANKNNIRPYCKECHRKRSHGAEPIKIPIYMSDWNPHKIIDDVEFGMNLQTIGGYNSERIHPGRHEHGE